MSHEECGVFGIYAPGRDVAALTYRGLIALQHRGQDAAGVAVSNGQDIQVVKDVGLVTEALANGTVLDSLHDGEFASGHVRYSTSKTYTYDEKVRAAQPIIGKRDNRSFALSQNGHTINAEELERESDDTHQPVTDGELIAQLISGSMSRGVSLAKAVRTAGNYLNGAYSLVVMGQRELIGLRDPRGFRPLVLGALEGGGSVIASEWSALDIVGASYEREIKPGELVQVNHKGQVRSFELPENELPEPALCSFEYVYFSRPDNEMFGENVEQVRFRMGQELAAESPVDADLVLGVPNSGVSAAYGYVDISRMPLKHGLTKNTFINRTFIASTQIEREEMARMKLSANKAVVEGKRVVAVDDSIIRSTTTKAIVSMLKEAGATEVHLRISSPPYKWPCFYGMNTGDINELIAASKTIEEIRREVGADSLEFLTVDAMKRAMGQAAGKVCLACATGNYPTPVDEKLTKRSEAAKV